MGSHSETGSKQGYIITALFQTLPITRKATVTKGLAIETFSDGGSKKSSIVEIQAKNDTSTANFDIYVSKTLFTNQTALRSGVKLRGDVEIRFENGWIVVSTVVGVSMRVRSMRGSLSVNLMIDRDYMGNVSGLMGNFNGEKNDDIRSRNGSIVLSPNATDREIFPVGMTYAVNCSNPQEAIFHYTETECAALVDTNYRPSFMSASNASLVTNPALKAKAETVCGTNPSCLFDVALTGDPTFGNDTKADEEELKETRDAENNVAPKFSANVTDLQLQLGSSGFLNVTATDSDAGDNVTLSLSSNIPWMSLNGGILEWRNVTATVSSVNLSVIATDSRGLTGTLALRIQLCQCQNNATCVWVSNNTEYFVDTTCECTVGLSGRYCEKDEDGCATGPCFSSCTDVPASRVEELNTTYQCSPCPVGYDGDGENCTDIDECITGASNCQQICNNTEGSFVCSCHPGFTTVNSRCIDIDECRLEKDSCDANSTCQNTNGGYDCPCRTGYHNVSGQCQDLDECAQNPSICITKPNSTCVNSIGSYRCQCANGFFQDTTGRCLEINECKPTNPCMQICIDRIGRYECACVSGYALQADSRSCAANRRCTDEERRGCRGGYCAKSNDGNINCICPNGYDQRKERSNSYVCENINECLNSSTNGCRPLGTAVCHDATPGYSCTCPDGYRLFGNQSCVDIDECFERSDNCDVSKSSCVNQKGSFSCVCKSGYAKDTSSRCVDIDECTTHSHNCPDTADCHNIDGSFFCRCRNGFAGNGTVCEDVDECRSELLNNCDEDEGKCVNSVGSFSCVCNTGYELRNESTDCVDKNECNLGSSFTGCWGDDFCRNFPGTYRCKCPYGMELMADQKSCEADTLCPTINRCGSVSCALSNGKETCICPSGTEFDSVSKICVDINECLENGDILCPAARRVQCVNTNGSFHCECVHPKFDRQVDSNTCIDIDECTNATIVSSTCNRQSSIPSCNNRDMGYDCVCGAQYKPNMTSEGLCEDINECQLGVHNCDAIATCVNVNPGYICHCPTGYQNAGGTRCADVDECSNGAHECDQSCKNTLGSYICECRTGYRRDSGSCIDINECSEGQSKCDQICTNTLGSYTCSCQEGFQKNSSVPTACDTLQQCPANHSCSHLCTYVGSRVKCLCPNDSYTLLSDSKTCRQKNGGWSPWIIESNCSKDCGVGVTSSIRQCSNPAPLSTGLMCLNEDGVTRTLEERKKSLCSLKTCAITPEESRYSVYLDFVSNALIGIETYLSHLHGVITKSVAKIVNEYCNANALECCSKNEIHWKRKTASILVFVEQISIGFGSDTPTMSSDKLTISIFVMPNPENELCQDINSTLIRRRRSVNASSTFLDKYVLAKALSPIRLIAATSAMSNALAEAGLNISISSSITRPAITYTTELPVTSTKTPTSETTDSWVIPVAVTISLVAVVIFILLIVFYIILPKYKSAKGAADVKEKEKEDYIEMHEKLLNRK